MRLIDADEFKRQVAAAAMLNGAVESAHKANVMIDLINMQPTVYDLEGVIKQIEERTEDARIRYTACNGDLLRCTHIRYATQYRESEKCLNIVKAGFGKRTVDENIAK